MAIRASADRIEIDFDLSPMPIDEFTAWARETNLFDPIAVCSGDNKSKNVVEKTNHYTVIGISVGLVREYCVSGRSASGREYVHLQHLVIGGEIYISMAAGRRFVDQFSIESALAEPVPTTARPGSPEKIEVLRQRAANGEQLFHSADATPANEAMIPSRQAQASGKKIAESIVARIRDLKSSGAPTPEIAARTGVSRTTILAVTKGIVPYKKSCLEPWLLRPERIFLEEYERTLDLKRAVRIASSKIWGGAKLSLENVRYKLGIETDSDLLLGFERYRQQEFNRQREEQISQHARQKPKDVSTASIDDSSPVDWSNIDIHRVYQLANIAVWRLEIRCFHVREDLVQDLVIRAPEFIEKYREKYPDSPVNNGIDLFLLKCFRYFALNILQKTSARQRRFATVKGYSNVLVLGQLVSKDLIAAETTQCVMCGEVTANSDVCSDYCRGALFHFREDLFKVASVCESIIAIASLIGGPITLAGLNGNLGLKRKNRTVHHALAWLNALGYGVEITPQGYKIGSMSRLDFVLWQMATQCRVSAKIEMMLRAIGHPLRVSERGHLASSASLSVAKQMMLYRAFLPWPTRCIVCGKEFVFKRPETLTSLFSITSVCCANCGCKKKALRRKKQWLV